MKISKCSKSDIHFLLNLLSTIKTSSAISHGPEYSFSQADNLKKDRACAVKEWCMSVLSARMYMQHVCLVPTEAEEGSLKLELSYGGMELSLGPPQEQQVLYTAEPSLQPREG